MESAPPLRDLKRRLKVRAGHFTVAALRQYFDSERFFIAHLVRLQNKITVEHDRLAEEVVRLHETIRRERAYERQRAALLHHRLEERLEALERRLAGVSPGDDD